VIQPLEAWSIRRLLYGESVNGELEAASETFRRLADHLLSLPADGRQGAWDGFLCARSDREALVEALAAVDPVGPPPPLIPRPPYATLADIARIVAAQPWVWKNWIAAGVLNAVASEPGTGKTRFGLDLARRLWLGLHWPDGQENVWAPGTRTLWVQGDRNYAEMLQAARDFGIPEDAVALGTSPDDPLGGLDLDDEATLAELGECIRAAQPALVVIDTVGMVTDRNLCRPEEARAFFAPIMDLARETGAAFLGLTHLSANKEALGRRIVEKARVVLKMTQPDPEGQADRRRLWVDKSAVVKPPPLGITMGDGGNEYDFSPPSEPEQASRRRGPSPEKLDACKAWLADRLTPNPARVTDVRTDAEKAGHAVGTLYEAMRGLGVEEEILERKKWWRLKREPGTSVEAPEEPM
jgi:AAA domain